MRRCRPRAEHGGGRAHGAEEARGMSGFPLEKKRVHGEDALPPVWTVPVIEHLHMRREDSTSTMTDKGKSRPPPTCVGKTWEIIEVFSVNVLLITRDRLFP